MFAINQASEIKNREQKKLEAQSINQSNELHLIQNENLKELLDRNPDLKKEVEETEKLIKTEITDINEFNSILIEISEMELDKLDVENLKLSKMKLESAPNYKRETILTTILIFIIIVALLVLIGAPSFMWLFYVMITLGLLIGVYDCFCFKKKINKINRIKADIKSRIMATKFQYWRDKALVNFFNKNFHVSDSDTTDKDYEKLSYVISKAPINDIKCQKQISNNILDNNAAHKKIWCLNTKDKGYHEKQLLGSDVGILYLRWCINHFMCDKSRNFILDERLSPLFNFKNWFYLQYIRCFMILSIYCHTPEILLSLLSNEDRYNFFKKFHKILEINLKDDDKSLFYDYLNSCREIILKSEDNNNDLCDKNRAIEVFDLDKIRNFEEPGPKKNLTLDLNKEKNTTILSNNKVNINKQNDSPKSGENKLNARHN